MDILSFGISKSTNSNTKSSTSSTSQKIVKEPKAKLSIGKEIVRSPHKLDQFTSIQGIKDNVLSALPYAFPLTTQKYSIPLINDSTYQCVVMCAPTGSGKTLAFLLPIVTRILNKSEDSIAMILVPTKELVLQMKHEIEKLCINLDPNDKIKIITTLDKSKDFSDESLKTILVATPIPALALLKEQHDFLIKKKTLDMCVFDEADQLFDSSQSSLVSANPNAAMDILQMIVKLEHKPKLVVSSATIPSNMIKTFESLVPQCANLTIDRKDAPNSQITQDLIFCGSEDGKRLKLRQMIMDSELKLPTLIFVQSIDRANQLFKEFSGLGLHLEVVHSARDWIHRQRVLQNMKHGNCWVLITTDMLSRGVDFQGVQMVINYDFPQSASAYIHRIGRTARGTRSGHAVTFYTIQDKDMLKTVASLTGNCQNSWMTQLPKPSKEKKRLLKTRPHKREDISVSRFKSKSNKSKVRKKV